MAFKDDGERPVVPGLGEDGDDALVVDPLLFAAVDLVELGADMGGQMGSLLHVGVDVVVRVGNALVAGRRAAPLAGVEQEAKVGPVGFFDDAYDVIASGGVVLQAHGDAYFEAVVGDLLKAADFAGALLWVGEGLAAEQADHGRAQNQRDVHVGFGSGDLVAQVLVAADEVSTGS